MRILLAPVGSHGDVHPFVGVGRVARQAGYEVVLITSEPFRPLAERHGFTFAATGTNEDYHALTHNPDLWHPTKALSVLFGGERPERLLRAAYYQIQEYYTPGKTVLLGGSLGLAARLAHEKLRIPYATVHLQPTAMLSVTDPPVFATGPLPKWSPLWLRRVLYWYAERFILDSYLAKPMNRLRAELGMPPIRRVYGPWRQSPQKLLAFYPAWYGANRDDPPHLSHVGFLHYDQDEQRLPPAVEQFLEIGPPPVVVSFGSAMFLGKPYFEAAVQALKSLGLRGLILAKSGEQIPRSLPQSIFHADYAPFSRVLPRAAAIIHHGGIGTAARAMLAGVPQFVMPMAFDQPDNAARLERLGVAVSLPASRFAKDSQKVAALLQRLLTEPSYHKATEQVKQLMKAEPEPAPVLLRELDELVGTDTRPEALLDSMPR